MGDICKRMQRLLQGTSFLRNVYFQDRDLIYVVCTSGTFKVYS